MGTQEWGLWPRIRARRDLTTHLTARFNRSTFNLSEVIVLTNKQTDAAENVHFAPLCYAGE